MNRFKFWRWGKLRKLGRPLYIILFTSVWTVVNVGLGIYRELSVLKWTWEEIWAFQSQMIFFVLFSGILIAWFTWDIGDSESLKLGIDNHVLDTDRLILRKISQVDFKAECKILMDTNTMQCWPKAFDKDEVRSWILKSMQSYKRNGFGRYIVERKKDHKIIGDVGFMLNEVNGMNEVDLGYIIHAAFQGKGYGTEAARACLEYGIDELGLERIVSHMPKDQAQSERVAQKIGMTKVGEYNNSKNKNKRTNLYVVDQRRPM